MILLKNYGLIILCCIAILGTGCGGGNTMPSFHIAPDVDYSFIRRVAVLPFDNLTEDRHADEIIRQVAISELLASGLVEVLPPGEVTAGVNRLGIKSVSSPTEKEIKSLGKALNVQAVLMGSVEKFGEVRSGTVPAHEVTITLMMADTASGSIIWSVTKTGGGAGFMARHFGARSDTMSETVLKVVREAIRTLAEY